MPLQDDWGFGVRGMMYDLQDFQESPWFGAVLALAFGIASWVIPLIRGQAWALSPIVFVPYLTLLALAGAALWYLLFRGLQRPASQLPPVPRGRIK